MTDDEIDFSDAPEVTEDMLKNAEIIVPSKPISVTLEIDPVVFAWFKLQGNDWRQRINAALRLYAAAHKEYAKKPDAA